MERRIRPFAIAGVVLGIVALAVVRLPDVFVAQLARRRALTDPQAGWAYRLLALAALAQAVYGGFVLLRPERVIRARRTDPKLQRLAKSDLVRSVARNAAGIAALTVVYGLAALIVTGQRGGFWLFPALALAQGAWYYREVGEVARSMELESDDARDERPKVVWQREPRDYCPPLVRALLKQSPDQRDQQSPPQ